MFAIPVFLIVTMFSGCATIDKNKLNKINTFDKVLYDWTIAKDTYIEPPIDVIYTGIVVGRVYQKDVKSKIFPLIFEYPNGKTVTLWDIGDYSYPIKLTQDMEKMVIRVFYFSGISWTGYNMNELNISSGKIKEIRLPKDFHQK